ncbi:IMPACT family protein [Neisseriaceae bacterium ESL0693]|nr:IMPACT family protein [Neisseriaceae bacterium ESL0693]
MIKTHYFTLKNSAEAEFKDKGSRFLAYACPVTDETDIKAIITTLREQHHKARHWCYAWRLGTDGQQFRANDDGEPAGTAGRPILGQIDSAVVTQTLVVVVRYFGGTLLGVSGLIQAYKQAAAAALQAAGKIQCHVYQRIDLQCDYAHLSEALRIARQFEVQIQQQDLQQDCRLTLRVPLAHLSTCCTAWQQTRAIHLIPASKPEAIS